MKQILIFIGFIISSLSLGLPSYRLEYMMKEIPSTWESYMERVVLNDQGAVYWQQCGKGYDCSLRHLETISESAMELLTWHIEEVTAGPLLTHKKTCDAKSRFEVAYAANHTTVLLTRGSYPCGDLTLNVHGSVKILKHQLYEWWRKAYERFPLN